MGKCMLLSEGEVPHVEKWIRTIGKHITTKDGRTSSAGELWFSPAWAEIKDAAKFGEVSAEYDGELAFLIAAGAVSEIRALFPEMWNRKATDLLTILIQGVDTFGALGGNWLRCIYTTAEDADVSMTDLLHMMMAQMCSKNVD